MKGMFKKAGRKRTESLNSGPGEVPRSPSEDTMPDGGSVADDSDTSSTYDEVCTLLGSISAYCLSHSRIISETTSSCVYTEGQE